MSQNDEQYTRCLYCREFTYDEEEDKVKVPTTEWVRGLRTSSCAYCRVLVHAIEAIEPPNFFVDLETQQDAKIQVTALPLGCVFVHLYRGDGTSKFLTELQVCTASGKYERASCKLNIALTESLQIVD